MIPVVAVYGFLLGVFAAGVGVVVADRRAIRREAEWWAQIRTDALTGYGRVFDWADDE